MSQFPLWMDIVFFPLVIASLLGYGSFLLGLALRFGGRGTEEESAVDRVVFSYGLGYGFLCLAMLVLGGAGLWNLPVLWGVLVLGLVSYARERRRFRWQVLRREIAPQGKGESVLALFVGAILTFHFVGCWAPCWGHDESLYHLTAPRQFLLWGKVVPTPNLLQANFPMNAQMGYLFCLGIGHDVLCKLFQWTQYLFIATILIRWVRSLGGRTGYLAVLLYFSAVLAVYQRAPMEAGSDIPLSAFFLIGLYALYRMTPENRTTNLLLAAAMNGFAWGTKYVAFAFVTPATIVYLYLRIRENGGRTLLQAVPPVALFLGVSLALFGPWMVKAAVFTNNPVYPLASSVFPSASPYDRLAEKLFEYESKANFYADTYHHPIRTDLPQPAKSVVRAFRGYWREKLSWAFQNGDMLLFFSLVASLAILGARSPRTRELGVVGCLGHLIFFLIYGSHLVRFFSVAYPLGAILSAGAIDRLLRGRVATGRGMNLLLGTALFLHTANYQYRWSTNQKWFGKPCFTHAQQRAFSRNRVGDTEDLGWEEHAGRLTGTDAYILGHGTRFPFQSPRRIYCVGDFEEEWIDRLRAEGKSWEAIALEMEREGFTHLLLRIFERTTPHPNALPSDWIEKHGKRIWSNSKYRFYEWTPPSL